MQDQITKRLEKRNAELQRIRDAKARWWKKLIRAANAYDRLLAEERQLLKPSKLPAEAKLKVTGEEYHQIHHQDFGDTASDLFQTAS